MTDRVDAAVNGVKPAGPEPVLNEASAHTGSEQLPPRHYSVLALGKLGDQPVHATI